MEYYKEVVFKKYAEFNGRARRKEYWMFVLFNAIFGIMLAILDGALGFKGQHGIGILGLIYSLAVLIPSIAVGVRRLHDTNRSAWWLLIVLVPFVGAIVLLVFALQDGTPGANKYGVNPKEKESTVVPTPATEA